MSKEDQSRIRLRCLIAETPFSCFSILSQLVSQWAIYPCEAPSTILLSLHRRSERKKVEESLKKQQQQRGDK